jgi:hypothetical protein
MRRTLTSQSETVIRLQGAFPASLAVDVSVVADLLPIGVHSPTIHDIGVISIGNESLHIPFRFYSDAPSDADFNSLDAQRQHILSCIYTRHHDGYVRQEYARRLTTATEPWVAPYLLQLVGEYVCEIIFDLLDMPPLDCNVQLSSFAATNPDFIRTTCRRVISYWFTYYSAEIPRFTDYPGYRILSELGLWDQALAPRLTAR